MDESLRKRIAFIDESKFTFFILMEMLMYEKAGRWLNIRHSLKIVKYRGGSVMV